jgi:formate-dependent nitrite reductase membrane component NrfD
MTYWAIQALSANPGAGVALPPRWGWYVILYFFLGGIAGGVMAIGAGLELLGDQRDRDAVRLAHRLAFPLIVVCGLLLIIDLGRPDRFYHMLFQSERLPALMFKPWSPISLGVWLLSGFGLIALIQYFKSDALGKLPPGVHRAWLILAGIAGFGLAGYTGVLVSGTSLAAWHNAQLMGALFLLSGVSTAYALMMLLLLRRGRRATDSTLVKLTDGDRWAVTLEALVLAVMLIVLGPLGRVFWSGWFGVVFWLGVVGLGLLVPLARHWLPIDARRVAACVLVGGLLLRFVIVMSPQFPRVALWHL